MKGRRQVEPFTLSFLDCVCCGFGAIILLLVISKTTEPVILKGIRDDQSGVVLELEQRLAAIRGETQILNRELVSKREQLSEEREKLARLQGDFSDLQGEFESARETAAVKNIIEGKLASARQTLTEEMKRLRAKRKAVTASDTKVGGIPVDSEYIIFVIDTSGSMREYSWGLVRKKLAETLDIYPQVKGIQVMNDMGDYMFDQYRSRWIPDTPARRKAILARLSSWSPFSNSSPVEGITEAIRTFYASDKRISIYVFGDEFTGESIDAVVKNVDRINRAGADGRRRVRIHAIGFPVQFRNPENPRFTGVRFAALMRALCYRNGGTFVALAKFRP